MKIKPHELTFIILLSFIIILILFLFYKNRSDRKEGFITKFYRPYYRRLKRGLNRYYNFFLNY